MYIFMKKLISKILTVSAVGIVVLTGCSKEQTSFDLEDIQTKAKIVGNLSYDAGQGYSSGQYTQLIKPAANTRVIAKVSNSSLSPNGESKGYTYYETTTDSNGAYELELPAVDYGTIVEIVPDMFKGTYNTVESVSNNTPKFNNEDVYYEVDGETFEIKPYETVVFDAIYTPEGRNIAQPYKYTSTFIVKVGEGIYVYNEEEDEIEKNFNTARNKNVMATINGVSYGATTNSDGYATFIIPSEKKAWKTNVVIKVEGYATSKYEYIVREYDKESKEYIIKKNDIKGGYYMQNSNDIEKSITFLGIDGVRPSLKVRMVFYPFTTVEDYGYTPSDWSSVLWPDVNN